MVRDTTPLERATGITILSPEDIIMGWEGTSKLIYCYKNDLNLAEWMDMLSDEFIESCVNKDFKDLDDHAGQDFLQIGLYLNMMKKKDWSISVDEKDVIKTIKSILIVFISAESINREIYKQWGRNYLPGSGKLVDTVMHKKAKYNTNSYSFKTNPEVNIVEKDDHGTDDK